MTAWIVSTLLVTGAVFALLASVGLLRMPDLYTRLQSVAKAGTLGAGCVLAAVAIHFGTIEIVTQALLVMLFLFLTTPVAAHMIARAGHMSGVPLSKHSTIDERQNHRHDEGEDGDLDPDD